MFQKYKGKCGCGKKQPDPSPFSRKLLLSLQHLQGNTRYHCGATVKDIARYMSQNFHLDGDVLSQVKISLEQNVYYGIVEECNNRYMLVGASAYVANTPENSVKREKEIERAHCIYPSVWRHRIPNKKSRESMSTSCKTNLSSVISLLTSKGSKKSKPETLYSQNSAQINRRRAKSSCKTNLSSIISLLTSKGSTTSESESLCSQNSPQIKYRRAKSPKVKRSRRAKSYSQTKKRKRSTSCRKQRRGRNVCTGQFCNLRCKDKHCLPESYDLKRCKNHHRMHVGNTSCTKSNYSSH